MVFLTEYVHFLVPGIGLILDFSTKAIFSAYYELVLVLYVALVRTSAIFRRKRDKNANLHLLVIRFFFICINERSVK